MKGFAQGTDGFWVAPPMTPGDQLDFLVDCSGILQVGDTIATVVWSVSNATIVTAKNTQTPTSATVWIDAPTVDADIFVQGDFVTTGGREFVRGFKIPCVAKI